jgi:hypothetical protein
MTEPSSLPRVQLRFYIGDKKDEPWDDEAPAWFAAHPEEKPKLYNQEGSIFVTGNGQKAQISDQLLSLIPSLCCEAVAAVLEKGVVECGRYNSETGVRLTAESEELEIVSNVFQPVRFPKWPVLEGLVACGERFLRMAETVWAGDTYHRVLPKLAESGAAARAKLDAARKRG